MARLAARPIDENRQPEIDAAPSRRVGRRLTAFLMLPREHGAWAMLLVPFILGTTAAGWPGLPSLLLVTSVLLLFTASRPMELAIQTGRKDALARLGIYSLLGAAAGVALVAEFGRWLLVPIGVTAGAVLAGQLLLRRRRLDRSWPARLASIAALSATGPAAYYASTGVADERALAVWVLAFLHSGASVFHVRIYYRPQTGSGSVLEDRRSAERRMVAYVAAALAVAVGLSAAGLFPPLGVVSLLPLVAKVAVARRNRDSRPTLKQIGLGEVGYSALFLLIAAVAMRLW